MVDRIGVYPGTFDPITNGHLDIIQRAARIFDRVIVGVAVNVGKGPLFELDERLAMVREECEALARAGNGNMRRVEVRTFDNLLTRFAHDVGASVIIRGLRAVSDFDYEFQMAGMNARVAPDIETVFLMASERHTFIASRFVKEIALLGGDITSFVPQAVAARLARRGRAKGKGRGGKG